MSCSLPSNAMYMITLFHYFISFPWLIIVIFITMYWSKDADSDGNDRNMAAQEHDFWRHACGHTQRCSWSLRCSWPTRSKAPTYQHRKGPQLAAKICANHKYSSPFRPPPAAAAHDCVVLENILVRGVWAHRFHSPRGSEIFLDTEIIWGEWNSWF